MEQEQQQSSIFNFSFDDTSKEHIKTIGIWAGINAILSFVGLAINIVTFVLASNNVYYRRPQLFEGFSANNGFTLFIQVTVSVVLNIFLFMASTQLKKGLQGMDNESLTKGFASLRSYYKIYGIVLIVVMILFLLLILFFSAFRR